jgi:hypothetical protein
MTEHQKREAIRRRDHDGEPVREIARSYNVSHSTISRLVTTRPQNEMIPFGLLSNEAGFDVTTAAYLWNTARLSRLLTICGKLGLSAKADYGVHSSLTGKTQGAVWNRKCHARVERKRRKNPIRSRGIRNFSALVLSPSPEPLLFQIRGKKLREMIPMKFRNIPPCAVLRGWPFFRRSAVSGVSTRSHRSDITARSDCAV